MPILILHPSWAIGDAARAGNDVGFIFLGFQVSDNRFILSVSPHSDVYLKGLGDVLEKAEVEKSKALGLEIKSENRRGYDSPDT